MTKHIITRYSFLSTQHYISVTVIALALLLFFPVVSWAASGVIELPKTGQTKCYDTAGAEISCAGTGQDGEIQVGVAWPSPLFVDNGDGTVSDNLTGLMWIKGETEPMDWQAALDYVKTLNTGGHTDWRLPNVNELRSLVDYSQFSPSLPQGHPFTNAVAFGYWSSTTLASYSYIGWGVIFDAGQVGYSSKIYGTYVRAVRGGQCGSVGDSVICLPKTGQTKCYDAAGAEIQCSGTRQDGDIQAGVAWPNPRFTVNGDTTITDNLTGLIWSPDGNIIQSRDPSFDTDGADGDGQVYWDSALNYVKENLNKENYLGHSDWRLPNVNELRSLVDYSQTNLSLPPGHPFTNVMHVTYWSSTTLANSTNDAWGVIFSEGTGLSYGKDEYTANFLAVRGGQSGSNDSSTTTTTVIADTTTTAIVTTTTTTASAGCTIESIQPSVIRIGLGLLPRIRRVSLTMNVDLESLGITCADLNIQNAPRGIRIISCAVVGDTIEAIILFWGIQPGTYNINLGPCGSIPFIVARF